MGHAAISYGRLIRLPNVFALLAATCLSRLASRMFAIAVVFHALAAFGSPALAGWISFAAVAPGLIISPLAGAFLDRAGAARGIAVDLAASAGLVLALALCVWLDCAGAIAIISLVSIYALTSPLSSAGIRVLLPRLVPARVLDRANALDTAIHAIVEVIGPALAGVLVGFVDPALVFVVIALAYGAATLCVALLRTVDPPPSSRGFLNEALEGLIYVLRRPLLRGLAIGYSLNNFTWGILVVAVPVLAAREFPAGRWETVAGLLWAGTGLAAGIGALAAGQLRLIGREVPVMVVCMAATTLAVWPIAAAAGIAGLCCGLALAGLMEGPIDVALLTLRQRGTDPGRLGRVLAVSMSINTLGFPIGTAAGGMLVAWMPEATLPCAALASLLGAAATGWLIPAHERGAR